MRFVYEDFGFVLLWRTPLSSGLPSSEVMKSRTIFRSVSCRLSVLLTGRSYDGCIQSPMLSIAAAMFINIHFPTYPHKIARKAFTMWHTCHIYFVTAIAVIGGSLFGFDILSMSAIISTEAYPLLFQPRPRWPWL